MTAIPWDQMTHTARMIYGDPRSNGRMPGKPEVHLQIEGYVPMRAGGARGTAVHGGRVRAGVLDQRALCGEFMSVFWRRVPGESVTCKKCSVRVLSWGLPEVEA